MNNHNLDSLNPARFADLIASRERCVSASSDKISKEIFNPNSLAELMHPKVQHLKVSEITQHKNAKTFKLIPDRERGTLGCAYFVAGQYVNVFQSIDGGLYSRPYSLCSSPKESTLGYYMITVKKVKGGKVSEYILNNWKVGERVDVSAPRGEFTYEPLRDKRWVMGIAGGSGITPFLSMAKAIAQGDEDFNLTVLYGCQTEDDILFEKELLSLCQGCEKIKVVFVLSSGEKEGALRGFITDQIIKSHAPNEDFSVFICGPKLMKHFVEGELKKLNVEKRCIRNEVHGEVIDPREFEGYPSGVPERVKITVKVNGKELSFSANSNTTLLRILEENRVSPPSGCRSGECGFCRSRLVSGRVFIPQHLDKRRQADKLYGYIHPCCAYPLEDLTLEVLKNPQESLAPKAEEN